MLSRVADSLYWLSRNSERIENNARILSVQLIKMLEVSEHDILASRDWEIVLEICGSKSEYESLYGEITVPNVVDYLAFSAKNPNSLGSSITIVRENARITRNSIPNELWETWNDFYLSFHNERKTKSHSLQDIDSFLQRIKTTSMTATGIIGSAMSRDLPYHFIKIGKWLERAEKTAMVMKVIFEQSKPIDEKGINEYDWRSALQLVNGYEDYSKKFMPLMDPKVILQFLVSDRTFPRSIRYGIEHVSEAIREIESEKVSHYSWQMYAALDRIKADFNEVSFQDLTFEEIEEFVTRILDRCIGFGKIFSTTYYLNEAVSAK